MPSSVASASRFSTEKENDRPPDSVGVIVGRTDLKNFAAAETAFSATVSSDPATAFARTCVNSRRSAVA